MTHTVTIKELGINGDGIGTLQDQTVYVAGTLPQEIIEIEPQNLIPHQGYLRASIFQQKSTSEDRSEAPCPHFLTCGACKLQHVKTNTYRTWKKEILTKTLSKNHIPTPDIEDILWEKPQTRRRITLHLQCHKEQEQRIVLLGLYKHHSHNVTEIPSCKVITTTLNIFINYLLKHKNKLYKMIGISDITITEIPQEQNNNFIYDITITTQKSITDNTAKKIQSLFQSAENTPLIRVMVKREKEQYSLSSQDTIYTTFDGKSAIFPPGSFLQATQKAEEALIHFIKKHIPTTTTHAADLFCGSGTFTIPLLSMGLQVTAMDFYGPAIKALSQTSHQLDYNKTLFAQERDLARYPANATELIDCQVAIIDPPRNGAEKQIKQLSTSHINTIILISCHYPTFTRDAKILIDNGYILKHIGIVDQFLWSHHLEIVSVFEKS